jgi:ferredoxin-NADP reductase
MKLTLTSRKSEVPGVESFRFKPQEPLLWKAGQFLHYVLHHEPTDDRGSDRWFTVATAPHEKEIMITTRFSSERGSSFKSALAALKTGDIIEVSDVDGDFTVDDTEAEYVFIAGGIGITPFRSILKEFDHQGAKIKVTLLYANRDEHIPYKTELDELARANSNLKIEYITGRVDEAGVREAVPNLLVPLFYISGPEPMVDNFKKMLMDMGVPEKHIKGDWFPGYPAE